ncbi:hypothetical protein AMIS_23370 [Actinoplanes missouriensis 431]|uniref:Uncharacterized protein n=1 Tax=Actinoplanes missouriensis (strain ATCC 14538 / DSM 43046 / CBS 188.64 / JCM 3121 / NBRC 102363 / NCIMB 12654 / NRRL B-3342 / UNCC 431) TaxID=512565 RepID=I0H3H0_ACTM4|nr:hypothetical protein [Actinoplanes missouriensis]BAL87557.1 hypothetical protein AMIS_23370 [Actinoplanes missouriensis 431]
MLWPALSVHCDGELTPDQLQQVIDTLHLDRVPLTEGPGARMSIAHGFRDGSDGIRLVLDLGHRAEIGWVFMLLSEDELATDETVEEYRAQLRALVKRFGLRIISVDPPMTADEVFVMPDPGPQAPEFGAGNYWDFPEQLDHMWLHLQLRNNAPDEVKAVKLRELMRFQVWQAAPEHLRRQVEEFLDRVGPAR